jgi:hypothetical protein
VYYPDKMADDVDPGELEEKRAPNFMATMRGDRSEDWPVQSVIETPEGRTHAANLPGVSGKDDLELASNKLWIALWILWGFPN